MIIISRPLVHVNTFLKIFWGENMSAFSNRIVQLKIERKLLQKDIAKAIGLSVRGYQYYETGQKEPRLSNLIALANYFNVSIDYLAGISDTPERR